MARVITVQINGADYHHEVEPRLLLVHYLREVVGLTGTHIGCETSVCGACTVLLNGRWHDHAGNQDDGEGKDRQLSYPKGFL